MPKAVANEIEIEYETVGDRAAPAFLLFMGAGEQLILWPRALKDLLTRAGYQVVSFDYRDAGLSTKFDQAGVVDLGALVQSLQTGGAVSVPYQLADMAEDAIGVLDHAGPQAGAFRGPVVGRHGCSDSVDRSPGSGLESDLDRFDHWRSRPSAAESGCSHANARGGSGRR